MPAKAAKPSVDPVTDTFEQLTAPWRQLTELAIENTEKLSVAQIESFTAFSALGLENAKAALAVKSATDLQTFAQSQRDVLKKATDQLATDAKTVAELSSAYLTTAQQVSQDTLNQAARKTA